MSPYANIVGDLVLGGGGALVAVAAAAAAAAAAVGGVVGSVSLSFPLPVPVPATCRAPLKSSLFFSPGVDSLVLRPILILPPPPDESNNNRTEHTYHQASICSATAPRYVGTNTSFSQRRMRIPKAAPLFFLCPIVFFCFLRGARRLPLSGSLCFCPPLSPPVSLSLCFPLLLSPWLSCAKMPAAWLLRSGPPPSPAGQGRQMPGRLEPALERHGERAHEPRAEAGFLLGCRWRRRRRRP